MINLIFIVAVFIFFLIVAGYWLYSIYAGAPFYPTGKKSLSTIEKFIKSNTFTNGIELGSGDGRISNMIAKHNIHMTAIEINPSFTLIHRLMKSLKGIKNVTIKNANFLNENVSNYDFAILYLFPGVMEKLEVKLFSEMKKNSYIISNTFQFKTKKPYKTLDNKIVIYKV